MRRILSKLFRRNPYGQSASAVLFFAADLLERDGWKQHSEGPGDPKERAPRCGVGAMRAAKRAVNGPREDDHFHNAIDGLAIHLNGSSMNFSITAWNDKFGQTKEAVIANMRAAARALKEKGKYRQGTTHRV